LNNTSSNLSADARINSTPLKSFDLFPEHPLRVFFVVLLTEVFRVRIIQSVVFPIILKKTFGFLEPVTFCNK